MTNTSFLAGEEELAVFRGPKLTADDYRRTPPGPPWYELIDGMLLAEPSPTSDHQSILLELVLAVGRWYERTRQGKLYVAPLDVYLSKYDVLQPDILYVSERRKSIVRKDGIHGPPDLVVEVLSPSNARITRTKKCAAYARCGVKEFWLVDPVIAAVHVYDFILNPKLPVRFVGLGEKLTSPLLPGFEAPVKDLFRAR